jgi:hypothetical protein
MTEIAEQFDVEVGNEIYSVTRVLDKRDKKIEMYGFTTVVDGQEYKLSTTVTSEVIRDLNAQYGIRVLDELTNVLLTEFQLEIAKIKETK